MSDIFSIVLAAGKGTRMKSNLPKVLHKISGKPMVNRVIEMLEGIKSNSIFLVVGYKSEQIIESVGDKVQYVKQKEQLGTGHAVLQAYSELNDKEGVTIVVSGDTPLLTLETIEILIKNHLKNNLTATILTTKINQPTGYGRIIRNSNREVIRIVEEKDTTLEEKAIKEINTGIYCFDNKKLFEALIQVNNNNKQGEYYLTDVIEILRAQGNRIGTYETNNLNESLGINDRVNLAYAEKILQKRTIERHMINGVTITDPDNTYIEDDVQIGTDTIIYPGTYLRGKTIIANECTIGPNVELSDTNVESGTIISHSVIDSANIDKNVKVGPFAYIRPDSHIGESVKIGDFVEIKNSTIGKGTKIPHHSYIGDAILGESINIGCGTITVNYDGEKKHQTKIEDRSFIGCNSNLIAPVTIGKDSYIAAGSTITNDVPDFALALAREKQINKEDYVRKIREKKASKF